MVLIACEESQVVTEEFRLFGYEAYSCDNENFSGRRPDWHLKCDVASVIDAGWDLIVAFPPCTHLCSSGARWFKEKRMDGRQQSAIDFFMLFADSSCPHIAIENPIGIMSTVFRRPHQVVQPWQFGHEETKATCFWLKGLPILTPTNVVDGREQRVARLSQNDDRSVIRSKTYSGIARAMAKQWGRHVKVTLERNK